MCQRESPRVEEVFESRWDIAVADMRERVHAAMDFIEIDCRRDKRREPLQPCFPVSIASAILASSSFPTGNPRVHSHQTKRISLSGKLLWQC
jgi:hypothetical protein